MTCYLVVKTDWHFYHCSFMYAVFILPTKPKFSGGKDLSEFPSTSSPPHQHRVEHMYQEERGRQR